MRKVLIFAFFLLQIVFSACAPVSGPIDNCGPKFTDISHVFVVTAIAKERSAVEKHLTSIETCTANQIIYSLGRYDGREIVVYQSGVGTYNADMSTEFTLDHFKVEALVFSGIAGGIDPTFKIGDTVVPEKWYELKTGNWIRVDADLLTIAKDVPGIFFLTTESHPKSLWMTRHWSKQSETNILRV